MIWIQEILLFAKECVLPKSVVLKTFHIKYHLGKHLTFQVPAGQNQYKTRLKKTELGVNHVTCYMPSKYHQWYTSHSKTNTAPK